MATHEGRHGHGPATQREAPGGYVDPVCGMAVKPDTAHRSEYQGTVYGFCCAGCLAKFQADPAGVLAKAAARAAAKGAGGHAHGHGAHRAGHGHGQGGHEHPAHAAAVPGGFVDPVCGMTVKPDTEYRTEHAG